MTDAVLSHADAQRTVQAIASVQLPDGRIPWVAGGRTDPWNMVEAAMALDAGGRHEAAARAYGWLARRQEAHGGWYAYYDHTGVVDATLDTNISAYIAVGVWHHWLTTGDERFRDRLWPVVDRAIAHVVEHQQPTGEIAWRADDPADGALLTGSSSVHASLRCAIALAETLESPRPEWDVALVLLADAIANREPSFLDKSRWAMDWYYPVLGGVLTGDAAIARIEERWDAFVVEGLGVRCVSDRPWITAAETCELALALNAVGDSDRARALVEWAQFLRHHDGSYWCGMNFEGERFDDPGEYFTADQPTWNSAAVVLANAVLSGDVATVAVFAPDAVLTELS